jgi:hypothetical protein
MIIQKDLQVVMLGHSGVGKTTYMASVYAAMNNGWFGGQRHFDGIGMRAVDPAVHDRLKFLDHQLLNGEFPAGTDVRSEYKFALTFKSGGLFSFKRAICDFVWSDYRGGALAERTEGNPQSIALHKTIVAADAIIIFVEMPRLVNGDPEVIKQLRRISAIIGHAVSQRRDPVCVFIAMTKADACDYSDPGTLAPVQQLFENLKHSRLIVASGAPISAVRKGMNMELPLVFSLAWSIRLIAWTVDENIVKLNKEIDVLNQQIAQHKATAWEYLGTRGVLNSVKCRFTGEKSIYERARECEEKATRALEIARERRRELQLLLPAANSALTIIDQRNLTYFGNQSFKSLSSQL